jgi:serine/threonine protein phosphatase PrpC
VRYVGVSALSHDGLVREHNEDSVVVGPWTLCAAITMTPQTLFFPLGDPVIAAVADGLGGHPAGDVASSLAVRHLARIGADLTDADAIRDGVLACNDLVYAEAGRRRERAGMGTTLAGIVLTDEVVFVFNVGDSRVYEVVNSAVHQVSVDDNEPAGRGERRSSVLTQSLGGRVVSAPVRPHISSRPIADRSRYLICTDGLTDAVDEPTIAAVLAEHDGGRAVFELWRSAIEGGAPDNVTIALAEVTTEPDVR